MIAQTDHQALYAAYRGTGTKAYRPERLLAIVILLILRGIRCPAKWAAIAKYDDRCKLVGRGITPGRTTFYNFRDRAAKFIEAFHTQMIQDAIQDKSIDPTEGCLDGTFVNAAASRHKIFRLNKISRRLSVIKRAIAQWDDPNQVASSRKLTDIPSWLAKTPEGRQRQLSLYRAAKAKILEEIDVNRRLPSKFRRDEDEITVSPADPDAVIGKDKLKVTRPVYNVQYMCDFSSDVILSYDVFLKKNDIGTLTPMIVKTHSILGTELTKVHADSGYCSLLEILDCIELDVDLFAPVPERKGSKGRPTASGELQISADQFKWDEATGSLHCPAGYSMRQVSRSKDPRADGRSVVELRFEQEVPRCKGCPLADKCLAAGSERRTVRRLENQSVIDAQMQKMASEMGIASGKKRKMRIERRYADSKKHRGGRDLHGRGKTRATAETGLMVVAQNALTLFLLRKRAKNE